MKDCKCCCCKNCRNYEHWFDYKCRTCKDTGYLWRKVYDEIKEPILWGLITLTSYEEKDVKVNCPACNYKGEKYGDFNDR